MPTKATKPVPDGSHTITPYLIIRDAGGAIEFYKKAFDAKELVRMPGPGGKGVMHAELQIGDSQLMLTEEWPQYGSVSPQQLGGTAVSLHLYVDDVDAWFERAVRAGCQVKTPVSDMFWGDRFGKVQDPFGHQWSIATHKLDLTPAEMAQAAQAAFAQK